MCLEDLRIGRGRINRPVSDVSAGADVTLAPDQKRVALLIAFASLSGNPDYINIFVGGQGVLAPRIVLSPVQSMFLWKVEELGQLVTGQLTFQLVNASGTAFASVTEIYTEINAPPLDTYKP